MTSSISLYSITYHSVPHSFLHPLVLVLIHTHTRTHTLSLSLSHTHTHTHIHIHTYTHKHTHTHTHTLPPSSLCPPPIRWTAVTRPLSDPSTAPLTSSLPYMAVRSSKGGTRTYCVQPHWDPYRMLRYTDYYHGICRVSFI